MMDYHEQIKNKLMAIMKAKAFGQTVTPALMRKNLIEAFEEIESLYFRAPELRLEFYKCAFLK